MVAWSCFYSTSQVNISDAKHWIQQNAMKGPASHVSENGQYTDGLITPAGTVSDKLDTHLCPDKIKVCSGLLEMFALSHVNPKMLLGLCMLSLSLMKKGLHKMDVIIS